MSGETYRPAEAASLLGIPSSTLRLYSVRFGSLLSPSAAQPVERGGGRPGYRVYTARDLDVLRDGKRLLEQGLTYDEARDDLGQRWRPVSRKARQPVAIVEAAEADESPPGGSPALRESAPPAARGNPAEVWPAAREDEWRALMSGLLRGLTTAQTLAEEWRRISDDRAEELAVLREQLRAAEEEARKPWWRRLFG